MQTAMAQKINDSSTDEFIKLMEEATEKIESQEVEISDLKYEISERDEGQKNCLARLLKIISSSALQKAWDIDMDSYDRRILEAEIKNLLNF